MSKEQFYLNLFQGRKDSYGSVINGKAITLNSNGEDETMLAKVNNHLEGKERLGFFNKLPELNVPWAVVEFEDHGNQMADDPLGWALKYQQLLSDAGVNSHIERSKNEGGNCYHLWIFFDTPINAGYVHDVLVGLAKHIDPGFNPEVFPKSSEDNLGNFMWLPLFGGTDRLGLGINEGRTVFIDGSGKSIDDQWKYLESIKRVSSDLFRTLESKYGLIFLESIDDEIATVFEQPGLESVIENCPFIKYCADNTANLSEPLWYAMISNLCRFTGGGEKIHELSKPYKGYSQSETDEKISHALLASGPITYAKIKELGWTGEIPDWPKSPAGWGSYTNIPDKIATLASITDPQLKARAIKDFISGTVIRRDPLQQEEILKALSKECGLGLVALRSALENAYANEEIDYGAQLKDILWRFENTIEKSQAAYEWFGKRGGRFYRDREHNTYLYFNDKVYRIDSNRPFKSLIFELADISESSPGGKIFFDGLANMAYERGAKMESFSWQYTDIVNNEIYLNLNNDNNELLKITPGKLETVKNGNNPKSILLQESSKVQPIEYRELDTVGCGEAFSKIKVLIFDNLACFHPDRYLYLSWALVYPLIGFLRTIPHMRLEGCSGSGKSRGMELISYLVYGESALKCASVASNYTDGALNPLILLDNIETRNLGVGLEDFIITAVTGIEKQKRKIGTDKENVVERVKTLINSSGIEGLNKNEMINRTLVIEFDRAKYGSVNWNELVYSEIVRNRDVMLSAVFGMVSKILDRIVCGELAKIKSDISAKYPNHSKNRADDYLAVMKMVASELLTYFGDGMAIDELFGQWTLGQDATSQNIASDTSPIIQYLSGLKHELAAATRSFEDYDIAGQYEPGSGRCTLHGTAGAFLSSFAQLAKKKGLPFEYKSAGVLAKRLKDSQDVLKKAGWEMVTFTGRGRTVDYFLKYLGDTISASPQLTACDA
jgi:hypothetical protein